MYINPVIADFKAYFTRDFVYGVTMTTIMDADIQKAIDESALNINRGNFSSQESYTLAFLLLTAYYMVTAIQNSTQGVAGRYSWLQSAKSVGNVSESFAIPQRILDNPEFAMLAKNNYGARYLMMVLPGLSGQIYTVRGGTRP